MFLSMAVRTVRVVGVRRAVRKEGSRVGTCVARVVLPDYAMDRRTMGQTRCPGRTEINSVGRFLEWKKLERSCSATMIAE